MDKLIIGGFVISVLSLYSYNQKQLKQNHKKQQQVQEQFHTITDPIANVRARTNNLLITCIDYRIQKGIQDFIKNDDQLSQSCDIFQYPGSSLQFTLNMQVMIDNIRLFNNLHGVETIYILDHELCGACINHIKNTNTTHSEHELHLQQLYNAKETILRYFPNFNVHLFIYKENGLIHTI